MSWIEFERSIVSPKLKDVARHWNEARKSRRMPAWTDIRPTAIKPHLPIVWSYEYDAAQQDFIGRLAGIAIAEVAGLRFKGARLSELRPVHRYPRALARARRVVEEPALYRGQGLVYESTDCLRYGERIILPLSSDGVGGDGIFGATEYKNLADCESIPRDAHTEVEFWFSPD
jgi:hypothetical protein